MDFQVKCQLCFKKIPIKSLKGVSKMFQGSFLLQFCSRMYLIAATRAEGGLVYHKRSAQIKKKYLEKADWSAQKLRVDFDGGAGFERVC